MIRVRATAAAVVLAAGLVGCDKGSSAPPLTEAQKQEKMNQMKEMQMKGARNMGADVPAPTNK